MPVRVTPCRCDLRRITSDGLAEPDWRDKPEPNRPRSRRRQPIIIDRNQYEAAFVDACTRVAGFQNDDLAHHGRRFLWALAWGWKLTTRG
jgi:hypothetical protein